MHIVHCNYVETSYLTMLVSISYRHDVAVASIVPWSNKERQLSEVLVGQNGLSALGRN